MRKGEFHVRMLTSLQTFDGLVISIIGIKKGVVNIFKTGSNSQEFRNILFFVLIVGKPDYIRIDRITFRSNFTLFLIISAALHLIVTTAMQVRFL